MSTPIRPYVSRGQVLQSPPLSVRLGESIGSIYNFLGLYLISLFSLNPFAAAEQSRFNLTSSRNRNGSSSSGRLGGSGSGGSGSNGGNGGGGSGGSGRRPPPGGGGRKLGSLADLNSETEDVAAKLVELILQLPTTSTSLSPTALRSALAGKRQNYGRAITRDRTEQEPTGEHIEFPSPSTLHLASNSISPLTRDPDPLTPFNRDSTRPNIGDATAHRPTTPQDIAFDPRQVALRNVAVARRNKLSFRRGNPESIALREAVERELGQASSSSSSAPSSAPLEEMSVPMALPRLPELDIPISQVLPRGAPPARTTLFWAPAEAKRNDFPSLQGIVHMQPEGAMLPPLRAPEIAQRVLLEQDDGGVRDDPDDRDDWNDIYTNSEWQEIIKELVKSLPERNDAAPDERQCPAVHTLAFARYFDHTLLETNNEISEERIMAHLGEAVDWGFNAVCVPPTAVRRSSQLLYNWGTGVCVLINKSGLLSTQSKVEAIQDAIADGATEVDVVVNIAAIVDQHFDIAFRDIKAIRTACPSNVKLKIVLETMFLADKDVAAGTLLATLCNVDYVKTCSGIWQDNTDLEKLAIVSHIVKETRVLVSAGGIEASVNDCVKMIKAGASRIGIVNGCDIMKQIRETEFY
ncbi:MAG: hypothetical protein M1825_004793 [Sarcosagium campestre]|nr:MAG: hypothetical protein M1825_004793 [Sarcosagium campestre]